MNRWQKRYLPAWVIVLGAFLILLAGFLLVLRQQRYIYRAAHTQHYIRYANYGLRIPEGYEIIGIDISRYQQKIRWDWVREMTDEENRKLTFVIIKATQGLSYKDPFYTVNKQKAQSLPIISGAYHFFDPRADGQLQALHFLNFAQLQKGDLLPVIDVEVTQGVKEKVLRKQLKACLDVIERWYGRKPILYSNISFYKKYLGSDFDDYPLWIAHYHHRNKPRIERKWDFWQFSEKATISGILGGVDINVFNGDSLDLDELRLE